MLRPNPSTVKPGCSAESAPFDLNAAVQEDIELHDEAEVRELLADLLTGRGHTVAVAGAAARA